MARRMVPVSQMGGGGVTKTLILSGASKYKLSQLEPYMRDTTPDGIDQTFKTMDIFIEPDDDDNFGSGFDVVFTLNQRAAVVPGKALLTMELNTRVAGAGEILSIQLLGYNFQVSGPYETGANGWSDARNRSDFLEAPRNIRIYEVHGLW